VTDAIFEQEFGRFGPIISVKCMRPRNDEEFRRGSMGGFVFFALREDAEDCIKEMDGAHRKQSSPFQFFR